jgi:alpha-galactosidase
MERSSTPQTRIGRTLGRRLPGGPAHVAATAFVVLYSALAVLVSGAIWSQLPAPMDAPLSLLSPPQAIPVTYPSAPAPSPPIQTTEVGLAETPPMGWNGYNHFHLEVTAATVEAEARALVSSGMKAAGYTYVNLDGGWDLRWRDARGALQPDPRKFPQGIRNVADYVHSLGLKFGIYTSAGTRNCAGTTAGSYGYYRPDAATFASWTVDYLKLDWCDIPYQNYPRMTHAQVSQMLARQMGGALAATGRAILYDVNDTTNDEPWSWARGMANMWRTAPDSQDRYPNMLFSFTHNVSHHEQAGRSGWNDPDMLEIGNGGMSITEYQSQFSLWAEMAAPLIAGNDLTTMSASTRSILTNQAVIDVDQDPLSRQGYPVTSAGGHWVLAKPLADGDVAVVLFNETDKWATISTGVAQVGLARAPEYSLLNLWDGTATEATGVIAAAVPPHGVVMYRIAESTAEGSRP